MSIRAKVENIVSGITLDEKIDLKKFASMASGLEYNPEKFPGVVFRIKKPKVAMLIFSSGKVICTGARSREDIDEAVKKLLAKLKEAGIEIKSKPKVEVQNIVASADLGFEVNLDMLAMECENTEYEPEQFPGLVFSLDEPKTVMLIFKSGRMIITGAKTPEAANEAAKKTKEIIESLGVKIS